jgi:hypothetical protein
MSLKNTNEEILVGDYDETNSLDATRCPAKLGFVSVEAASVAEAVKHFKADQPAGGFTRHRSA